MGYSALSKVALGGYNQPYMERSVYRIIDANFNRAREAIRVIEEFCRFCLSSDSLTERAKQLRHQLSSAISRLDTGRLISSRDAAADVGASRTVDGQIHRADLRDCFVAGCKRLTEALRALGEMAQIVEPSCARTFEELRFAAYTLEKEIVVFSDTVEKFRRVRLYVIISSVLPADVVSLTHCCIAGGADCIQLRAKALDDATLFVLAAEFAGICRDGAVLSIINDRIDIAAAVDADGVHLGQDDLSVEQARRLQFKPLIIGKSTHSMQQLSTACQERPTYVALGPVFATLTKPVAVPVGLGYVRQATEFLSSAAIASVAVGGITLENIGEVLDAGASAVAVCSAVAKADDPAGVCRALKEKIIASAKK
jgi:thiamine-phosphate pyrophosphorylase